MDNNLNETILVSFKEFDCSYLIIHRQVDSRFDRRQYPKRNDVLVGSSTTNVKCSLCSPLWKNPLLIFCSFVNKSSHGGILQGYAKLVAVLTTSSEQSDGYLSKTSGAKKDSMCTEMNNTCLTFIIDWFTNFKKSFEYMVRYLSNNEYINRRSNLSMNCLLYSRFDFFCYLITYCFRIRCHLKSMQTKKEWTFYQLTFSPFSIDTKINERKM